MSVELITSLYSPQQRDITAASRTTTKGPPTRGEVSDRDVVASEACRVSLSAPLAPRTRRLLGEANFAQPSRRRAHTTRAAG